MKSYQQHCGLAKALDLLGGRWTLLILRDLLLGPLRYGELRTRSPGLTTNLLAERLKELLGAGVIVKTQVHGVTLYELTERGRALEPAILSLGEWGFGLMQGPPLQGDRVDLRWGMLSTKRRYLGTGAGVVAIIAGERRFEVDYSPQSVAIQEGQGWAVRATARGTREQAQSWLFGGAPFTLEVEGDVGEMRAYRRDFGLR